MIDRRLTATSQEFRFVSFETSGMGRSSAVYRLKASTTERSPDLRTKAEMASRTELTETRKAESASSTMRRMPMPPNRTGNVACNHAVSYNLQLVIRLKGVSKDFIQFTKFGGVLKTRTRA